MIKWEPETQALINAAELEVRPENVNMAVRQWLRHILAHRRYLEKTKKDSDLHAEFRAKANIYNREYRKDGPKRDRPKKREGTSKIFAEKFPERMSKAKKKEPLDVSRDDVTYLGPL